MEKFTKEQIAIPMQSPYGLPTPPEPTDLDNVYDKSILDSQRYAQAPDINQQKLNIKLQFSNLVQSLNAASMLDERGFWNGGQEDESLRLELQELVLQLQKTVTLPIDALQSIAQAHHCEAALRYAACNRIAEHVPIDSTITYRDLAAKASVNEDQCRRILSLLMSHHVFSEVSPGTLTHTPISMQLLDPNIRAWAEYQTTDSLKSSTCLSEATAKWPGSSNTSETAFSLAHDTDMSMFQYFDRTPGKLDRFRKAMTGMAHQPAFDVQHVLSGYRWRDVTPAQEGEAAVVVDVGGGCGHVASAISDAFPSLKLKVQDLGVATTHSKGGIDFAKYDFFTPQPIKTADVYFMRQVIHDWSDEYAVRILQNQMMAMGPRSKLVIMDLVLLRSGEWTLSEERKSRMTDIIMLTLFNSKARAVSEWIELVKKASNSRMTLTHFARPPGSMFSVMEFSIV